jgi:transcriptional regulator with GAF, ATPase, and Fis domain
MLDSELFGYRRGAFTGAVAQFAGVIRNAAGGTVFLDEIGEVSLDLQPKLLRLLESHEVQPLGEPQPVSVDVRVLAATNADLDQLVADGRFREDLYCRLNVIRLHIPPLRARRGWPSCTSGRARRPRAGGARRSTSTRSRTTTSTLRRSRRPPTCATGGT